MRDQESLSYKGKFMMGISVKGLVGDFWSIMLNQIEWSWGTQLFEERRGYICDRKGGDRTETWSWLLGMWIWSFVLRIKGIKPARMGTWAGQQVYDYGDV
jgi:hypothetical protein